MEFLKRAVPVIFAVALVFSCAKSEDEPYWEKELRSFERWMATKINIGGVTVAEKYDDHLYVQWLDHAPVNAEAPVWGDYIEINYQGLLISDYDPETGISTVFMNREEEEAKRLGSFQYYTHYTPQLIIYNRSNSLMEGMRVVLQDMKVGDKVRLFMSSSASATTSALTMSYGYGGNTTMPSGVPVIVEMELTGIVEQPQTEEEKFVNDFAANEWSQSLRDTIRENVYMNLLNEADLTDAEPITEDSTARVYYSAFLAKDNFLIETNIDSTARRLRRDVSTSTYVSFKPSSPPESPTALTALAIREIFNTETVKYGSEFEVISTSAYAYGASGQAPAEGTTEVLPYQPVRFYVKVEEYDYGDDDE